MEVGIGRRRCVGHLRLTVGNLRLTVGHLRVTRGNHWSIFVG